VKIALNHNLLYASAARTQHVVCARLASAILPPFYALKALQMQAQQPI
jgi:hypothetical protein